MCFHIGQKFLLFLCGTLWPSFFLTFPFHMIRILFQTFHFYIFHFYAYTSGPSSENLTFLVKISSSYRMSYMSAARYIVGNWMESPGRTIIEEKKCVWLKFLAILVSYRRYEDYISTITLHFLHHVYNFQ